MSTALALLPVDSEPAIKLFEPDDTGNPVADRIAKAKTITRRRLALLAVDPHCYYCGADLTEKAHGIDHLIPESRGGTDCWLNLRLACNDCNTCKGDALPVEWRDDLREIIHILARRLAGLRKQIRSESLDTLRAELPRGTCKPFKLRKPRTVSDEIEGHEFYEQRSTYQIIDTATGQILVRGLRMQAAVHYLRVVGPDDSLGLVKATRLYNAKLGLVRSRFNVFEGGDDAA